MNEFIDPKLGRMVAVGAGGCNGCAYKNNPDGCSESPTCFDKNYDAFIWVRAEDAPQKPKGARLTDEQIAEQIAQTWVGHTLVIDVQRSAEFARAIEAAVLKANGMEAE